jgi:hypothetical protein
MREASSGCTAAAQYFRHHTNRSPERWILSVFFFDAIIRI